MKWFKKKLRSLPDDTICRNCGAQTMGRYCHLCGQDLLAGMGEPFLKIVWHALENTLALDGKAPRTLVNLLFRPGFLSEEYRLGKVHQYAHPVKMFWMVSLIFFALLIPKFNSTLKQSNDTIQDIANKNYKETHSPTSVGDSVSFQTSSDNIFFSTDNTTPINEATSIYLEKLTESFNRFAPYAAFLLIPIFALLLMLHFWRKKYYYMYHLIFAIHYHTFLWIYFSILLISSMIMPNFTYPKWIKIGLFLLMGAYLAIAFHRFYHTRTRWKAIRKAIGIGLIYLTLILAVSTILIVVLAKTLFPEIPS